MSWRQWGSRYAIRAGRNLPDKEFRYLRTVIVTAAVYWGFRSMLSHLTLTFQHRAGVRPYTSSYEFAESCVFSKQSLPPILCPPHKVAFTWGLLIPKLRRQFAEFLQHHSLKRLSMFYSSTCVGFRYGLYARVISWNKINRKCNPISTYKPFSSVTSSRFRNINLIPIGYAFQPHLRGRLTLRWLTLRRKPWIYGDRVSHSVYRYLCQHSHFWYLHNTSQYCFISLQNAPLPIYYLSNKSPSFGIWF